MPGLHPIANHLPTTQDKTTSMTMTTDTLIDLPALSAAVREQRDAHVRMLSDLVAFPSLLGQEGDAQRYMAQTFERMALQVDEFEIDDAALRAHPGYSPSLMSYAGRPNVVGIHKPRREARGVR